MHRTSRTGLIVETSPDGSRVGSAGRDAVFGTAGYERWLIDLSELEGRSTGGLRVPPVTNAAGTDEGVTLDDLEVFCVPPAAAPSTSTGARRWPRRT